MGGLFDAGDRCDIKGVGVILATGWPQTHPTWGIVICDDNNGAPDTIIRKVSGSKVFQDGTGMDSIPLYMRRMGGSGSSTSRKIPFLIVPHFFVTPLLIIQRSGILLLPRETGVCMWW
ncbi:hypothetical protein DRP53_03490 [candidate division WOR-3 bacterium]|uniref:Uncharacterized protein n=1 Tax=candidate division WOR-3 bacterium TaxID=2052148 RepID=A0A660SLH5_UNCW3|nr:MAG: hypothetical protein DRP53_03490 [candidate division WOR-3 bacterium]